jgi:hypothetical protein
MVDYNQIYSSAPAEHLQWWQQGIDHLFDDASDSKQTELSPAEKKIGAFENHPHTALAPIVDAKHGLDGDNSL